MECHDQVPVRTVQTTDLTFPPRATTSLRKAGPLEGCPLVWLVCTNTGRPSSGPILLPVAERTALARSAPLANRTCSTASSATKQFDYGQEYSPSLVLARNGCRHVFDVWSGKMLMQAGLPAVSCGPKRTCAGGCKDSLLLACAEAQ